MTTQTKLLSEILTRKKALDIAHKVYTEGHTTMDLVYYMCVPEVTRLVLVKSIDQIVEAKAEKRGIYVSTFEKVTSPDFILHWSIIKVKQMIKYERLYIYLGK